MGAIVAIVDGSTRRLPPKRVLGTMVVRVWASESGGNAVKRRRLLDGANRKGARRCRVDRIRRGPRLGRVVLKYVVLPPMALQTVERVEGRLHRLVRVD